MVANGGTVAVSPMLPEDEREGAVYLPKEVIILCSWESTVIRLTQRGD